MIDKIVRETIDSYINKDMRLMEYKNPNDSDTIRVCADQLENLYNNIIANGGSRHEYSIMKLYMIIAELRKIQKWFD